QAVRVARAREGCRRGRGEGDSGRTGAASAVERRRSVADRLPIPRGLAQELHGRRFARRDSEEPEEVPAARGNAPRASNDPRRVAARRQGAAGYYHRGRAGDREGEEGAGPHAGIVRGGNDPVGTRTGDAAGRRGEARGRDEAMAGALRL